MRNFVELASEWKLQRAFACRTGTLYQFKTPERLRSSFDWGMSNAFHFEKDVPAATWVSLRERVEQVLRADEELRDLITFVPYSEVGVDFVIQCKPPFDGGYFLSSLNEWIEHGDSCRPPEACEVSNARLQAGVQRVIQGLPAGGSELLAHVIRKTFTEDTASQLQFIEDGHWRIYELQLADEYVDHLLAVTQS